MLTLLSRDPLFGVNTKLLREIQPSRRSIENDPVYLADIIEDTLALRSIKEKGKCAFTSQQDLRALATAYFVRIRANLANMTRNNQKKINPTCGKTFGFSVDNLILLRNRLVHNYSSVPVKVFWEAIRDWTPVLLRQASVLHSSLTATSKKAS